MGSVFMTKALEITFSGNTPHNLRLYIMAKWVQPCT